LTNNAMKLLGQEAELQACAYLMKQNLRLVKKNYLCKVGEIDLVMQDKNSLVFVEVRYRKPSSFGSGAESVTRKKQQKIMRAAEHYLLAHKLSIDTKCRFDVVAVTPAINPKVDILWIKNAFEEV